MVDLGRLRAQQKLPNPNAAIVSNCICATYPLYVRLPATATYGCS